MHFQTWMNTILQHSDFAVFDKVKIKITTKINFICFFFVNCRWENMFRISNNIATINILKCRDNTYILYSYITWLVHIIITVPEKWVLLNLVTISYRWIKWNILWINIYMYICQILTNEMDKIFETLYNLKPGSISRISYIPIFFFYIYDIYLTDNVLHYESWDIAVFEIG